MGQEFGGFSHYSGEGGWVNGGMAVKEDHVRLVANTTDMNMAEFTEYLIGEAKYAQVELNEDAVMWELHEIRMGFVGDGG